MYIRTITTLLYLCCTCLSAQAACIAVIPAGAEHMFWMETIRGATTAAREDGYETYVRSPNTERNEEGQVVIVTSALEQGCEGVMVAPNSIDLMERLPDAVRRDAPIVYFDRVMGGAPPASIIKTDNFKAGEIAGRALVKRLNGKGRVALLRMHAEVTSTTERETGFLNALSGTGVDVIRDLYIGSTVQEAREASTKFFLGRPEVDALFTPNESTTIGTLLTLKHMGLAGKYHHIGFDFAPLLMNALEAGEISGLVIQDPYQMGYSGAKTLIRVIKGEQVPKLVDIPAYYVDLENLRQPEIQEIVDVDYE
ncbi:substrate-binding domain-containing protein [Labrenzia sp. VG12]|uniref:substrate-binding domain-containing protein n=1 Tax=Labrenzia sp. VG12 TaxID=2021862 RepID=UPI000B8C4A04|nr:substrate-binding domain-containing protein [Labrenzia sp. VG12]ASP36039.1 hypothetical protein CHH27_24615 [Labrenzia sp. VG12]